MLTHKIPIPQSFAIGTLMKGWVQNNSLPTSAVAGFPSVRVYLELDLSNSALISPKLSVPASLLLGPSIKSEPATVTAAAAATAAAAGYVRTLIN